jgi:hypothetical protein
MVKAGKSLRPSIQPPPCPHPFTKDFLMASDFLAKACMIVNSAPDLPGSFQTNRNLR